MAASLLLLASATSALAADERRFSRAFGSDRAAYPFIGDTPRGLAGRSLAERSLLGRSSSSVPKDVSAQHHDGSDQHLPAVRENIELVGELQVETPPDRRFDPATDPRTTVTPDPSQPGVVPEQIADVAVYKNFAYLNSWDEPSCKRGGTFIVDISNPTAPQQIGFLPALAGRYHGEGAHVISLDTLAGFKGDVLAVNNEPYSRFDPATGERICTDDIFGNGGFDLYDVTNPRQPKTLVQGFGDFEDDQGNVFPTPNSTHSVFMWQADDRRAYAVFVDNIEETDVDIAEITDPRNPRLIAEYDLVEYLSDPANGGVDIVDGGGLGGEGDIFLHDMVVKKMGDRFVMLADYWDAGYVTLDVTNPAKPTYIGDTTFDGPDPLTGAEPPEGNAHQGEFSYDNRFILAADEDFTAFPTRMDIDGQNVQPDDFGIPVTPDGEAREELLPAPGDRLRGDTRYIGDACVPAQIPAPQGEESIAVAERGTCDFDVKAGNAEDAGYEAILIFNNVIGPEPRCDETPLNNMTFDGTPQVTIKSLLIQRSLGFQIIDAYDPNTYECERDDPTSTPAPAPNRAGLPVDLYVEFDGWGYVHLYENTAGKMRQVEAYAIPEAMNPTMAFGRGDLSVHEFATDPTEYVAYSSYYAGGMRVFTFGDSGLTEQGKWIDDEGSNFWGVEQFTHANQRYFAGSDRDFGLQIFRYTGPGAAQRPVCTDSVTMVGFKATASVLLPCSDVNGNALTRSVTGTPSHGTLGGDAASNTLTYQHTGASVNETDSLTFTANDGTMTSEPATARIVIGAREGGPCFNRFTGSRSRENIEGSTFGDLIRAGGGRDFVDGDSGDDCLFGQGGEDQLEGGTDDDNLRGGAKQDRVFGGSGRDTHRGGKGADHLRGSSGNDRMFGEKGADIMDGGSNRDRMRGGKGRDRLRGGPGRDRLFGGGKRDRLEVGDGNRNLASGGRGNDRIFTVNGNRDTIRCGPGRDRVRGDRIDRVAGDCEQVLEPRD